MTARRELRESGARGARRAWRSLGGGGAPCAPLWQRIRATVVFVHQTARPTRFSTRKAVQGGAEGAWGLGSECCGQALRWRRVCAPVLRRQRCACERLTSRGVRGRVGFRFGRPVFWAGAGAEGLRRWPASLLQTALGAEAGPAPDERRGGRITVSSLGGGRSASGVQDPGRSIRAQRWSSRIGPDMRPRGAAADARRPGSCFPLHATEQTPPQGRRIDGVGANVLYHTTWAALPARPRRHRNHSQVARTSSRVGGGKRTRSLVSALDLNLHTRGARALV